MRRSIAFAQKADEEGYSPVASLFRASVAAERVHLRNLALAMKKLGYEPEAVPELVAVKSTAEKSATGTQLAQHLSRECFARPSGTGASGRFQGSDSGLDRCRANGRVPGKVLSGALAHLDSAKGKLERDLLWVQHMWLHYDQPQDFHICKVCYHTREKTRGCSYQRSCLARVSLLTLPSVVRAYRSAPT